MNSADDEVYDIATFFKSTAFSRICPLGEESFPWEGVVQRHCGRDPAQEPLLACQCPDTALPTVGLQQRAVAVVAAQVLVQGPGGAQQLYVEHSTPFYRYSLRDFY